MFPDLRTDIGRDGNTLRSVYVFYMEYMTTPLPELTMHFCKHFVKGKRALDVLELHIARSNIPVNRQFKANDSIFDININMPTDTTDLTECQHVLEVV